MVRLRLDNLMVEKGLVSSRSQAASLIKLGKVSVDGKVQDKPGVFVSKDSKVDLSQKVSYVNRAALKLESVSEEFGLDFQDKLVLDVGSSTGGFTDFALRNGAKKVIAVDVGTDQIHPTLRKHPKIDLREKTDIRSVQLDTSPDIILIDVSFVSLRDILPHIASLSEMNTQIVAMVKPQFEAGVKQMGKGVVKNETIRRNILKEFELWARDLFVVVSKKDSEIAGAKGNKERFYLLTLNRNSTTSSGRIR